MDETLDAYEAQYEAVRPIFHELIVSLRSIALGQTPVAPFLATPAKLSAFRYLTAPPVSADDLATLSGVPVSTTLHTRAADVALVLQTVLQVIDPHRFPWIKEERVPSAAELEAAILASSAMVAAQMVMTGRRSDATVKQEQAVKDALIEAGYAEVPRRVIGNLHNAPAPMTFCGESMLGSTRADIVATMPDHRVIAIECKASNSAVNSFKRVNHEALGKATKWRGDFGAVQVIPAAVLSGVFNPANLLTAQNAQNGGIALFWQFRLQDLIDVAS